MLDVDLREAEKFLMSTMPEEPRRYESLANRNVGWIKRSGSTIKTKNYSNSNPRIDSGSATPHAKSYQPFSTALSNEENCQSLTRETYPCLTGLKKM